MFRLDGKTAIVTGGGSGIGQAICELFARQGAHVAVLDISAAAGEETASRIKAVGGKASVYGCDVTKADQLASTFDAVLREAGGLDILVNNAGIAHVGTIETTSEADFDRVLAVNLRGVYLCLREELRVIRDGGAVVNCSSVAGLVGIPGAAPYVASKHGVVGLTRSAALEAARRNVRVNAVCPGAVDTPLVDRYVGDRAERRARLVALHPLGRLGRPDEVADAVVWLCGGASFVTGQALAVDGGWTVG